MFLITKRVNALLSTKNSYKVCCCERWIQQRDNAWGTKENNDDDALLSFTALGILDNKSMERCVMIAKVANSIAETTSQLAMYYLMTKKVAKVHLYLVFVSLGMVACFLMTWST